HELRTPLNTVIGLAEALQEEVYGVLNDEQLQAIENVEESGRHLLALINDILDLAKIEAGRLDLELAPVSVQAVCEASLRLVRQTAHQKRLHTSFSFDEPVTIPADERRLKQVLVNLLSNAVKFTPEGGKIGLEVKADRECEAVHFAIWDTGIGIKPEDRPRLFTPFVQLDSALSRGYEGTGLGLSLVQRMVRLHGGGVAVESEPERGSRFIVSLPWPGAVSPALALAPAGGRVPRTGGGPFQQALIVEDSRVASDQLSRYLDALGVDSIVHSTGADAVERAVAIGADLVLLDLLLPDGLGWDVLAQLRSDSRTEAIPVVIVSVVDERSRGLAAGAADYLVKPVSAGQVQSAVRRLSTTAAQRSSLAATVIPVETDSSEPRPRVLLADDNENNIKVLADYLRVKGHEVIVARNGIEAIELVKGESPDVVLMDIQMPGMDGLEAIRRLRADAAHANVPIIALTALAMPGDRELCLAAGATDYLSKPVGLSLLARTIAYHLHQQPVSPTMPRSDRTPRSAVPPRGRANVETQN
ncbi:MAG: response regulator, partial [Chloroflexi bacterium]|nr:response regulator [Chloroflexota bacterium]